MTLGRFIDEQALRFAHRPALVTPAVRWSYADLHREVAAWQSALTGLGIRPGERVAVWLSNFPDWIAIFFAVTRLGAVLVPLNARFGSHDARWILDHSESVALVAMGRYLGRDYAGLLRDILGIEGHGFLPSPSLPRLRHLVGFCELDGDGVEEAKALRQQGLAGLAATGTPPPRGVPADPAVLFYTSGTTSVPKGVLLSHDNLLPHSIDCGALLELTCEDRVLSLYPFFGISGGANKVLSTLAWGASLVFTDAFRAEEALDLLDRERCTVVHAVDVQMRDLVAAARARGGVPSIGARRCTIGFMTGPDAALAREMRETLGIERFIHPYGMTETNPMVLRNALDDPFEVCLQPGGRVAPTVEVRIADPDHGADLPDGTPGEILVRGRAVTRGYHRNTEATAASFLPGGWFRTGDLGVRQPHGLVFYLGRLKDMVKTGGFNVSPAEVETFLRTHPDVLDVGVTGMPDKRLGEVVVAFVTVRPGSTIAAEALVAYCKGRIANFKVPRQIRLVEALPYQVGPHGAKLRRDVLRQVAREDVSA